MGISYLSSIHVKRINSFYGEFHAHTTLKFFFIKIQLPSYIMVDFTNIQKTDKKNI